MQKLPYLFAAAAISGLALAATPGSASPLTSGLAGVDAVTSSLRNDQVQNVHYRSRRCRWVTVYDHYEDDWVRVRKCFRRRHHHPGVAFGAPFIGFSFGLGHHRHRHHFKRHHDWWD